ncbi:MAG: hypothetical protein ACR2KT_04265 [Methylocella sp.]
MERHARAGIFLQGVAAVRVCNKLGLTLVSEKTGEERVYRIVANAVSPKRKARPGRKA